MIDVVPTSLWRYYFIVCPPGSPFRDGSTRNRAAWTTNTDRQGHRGLFPPVPTGDFIVWTTGKFGYFQFFFTVQGALSFRNAIIHHRDLDGIPGNSSDIIKLCFWICKYLLFWSIFKSSKAKFSIQSIISWCHPKPKSFLWDSATNWNSHYRLQVRLFKFPNSYFSRNTNSNSILVFDS